MQAGTFQASEHSNSLLSPLYTLLLDLSRCYEVLLMLRVHVVLVSTLETDPWSTNWHFNWQNTTAWRGLLLLPIRCYSMSFFFLFNHTSFVLVLWDLYFFLLNIFQTYIYFCVTFKLFSWDLQNLTNYTFLQIVWNVFFSYSCFPRICVPVSFDMGKLISRCVFCVTFANLPSRCKTKRGCKYSLGC